MSKFKDQLGLDFLKETNRLREQDKALKELSQLFSDVAQAADAVSDAGAKTKLKVAAAAGQEKLNLLKSVSK